MPNNLRLEHDFILVKGAKEHNLKNVEVRLPKNKLIVITGVSGSGKSSLAFDTIYVEGKRRYMNSLSTYTRHLEINDKPDVEEIIGLSPTVAIEQKNNTRNPRSTVATITEAYDYLRILFARIGIPHSPHTGLPITKNSSAEIIHKITALPEGTKVYFIVPTDKNVPSDHRKTIINLKKNDCSHLIIDGEVYTFDNIPLLDNHNDYTIEGISKEMILSTDMECQQAIIYQVYKCLMLGQGIMYLDIVAGNVEDLDKVKSSNKYGRKRFTFSEKYCCPSSGFQIDEIEPKLFSFNSPHGACRTCDGLGIENAFSKELIIPNTQLSLAEGAIAPWEEVLSKTCTVQQKKVFEKSIEMLAIKYDFSLDIPFEKLPSNIQKIIFYGSDEVIKFSYGSKHFNQKFEGIIPMLQRELTESNMGYVVEELKRFQLNMDCSDCRGTRLRHEALAVQILGLNIGELCKLTILEMYNWFGEFESQLSSNHWQIASKIVYEVRKKLKFLVEIGVGYLTLNRRSSSLSGGESQRIKIASQLGCGLEGLIYVLDEPSIGLHQSDNDKLLSIMKSLCNLGNTVIVVEHDEDTIRAADFLIDVGPGAGRNGGTIVASGTPSEVAQVADSITGKYLSGKMKIEVPNHRRKSEKYLEVQEASSFNLKNINVNVPLNCFVAITGVSGSGKSTFAIHTLYKALMKMPKESVGKHKKILGIDNIDKIIQVDQTPIGRTPRSNPITYINAFAGIRDCFAAQSDAKQLGYNSGCFSFNVKGGRCESCEGDGYIKIEMHFMPDVYIKCDVCNGMRYNSQILQIKYKGYSISDILNMTADEAVHVFEDTPLVHEKIVALQDVGLGYLQIGQSATTLSGGEAQRIKLAKELAKRSIGNTLYILDEPTTGLHTHDISKLLKVLHRLVNNGHSVITIEHNLDVIKNADYVIDFGPYGGNLGGEVVAVGTPEEVSVNRNSLTGRYLKDYLI